MKKVSEEDSKKILFDILKYFDGWCKNHNLHYSLAGGTLLGAIRHKGFIPWDDDLDLFMERKEYEILLKEWDGPYDLITNKQKGWYTGHARIADRKTTLRWDWGFGIEHGLWIAILPIDNFPEEDCEWTSFKKKLDFAMSLGKLKNVVWVDSVSTIRNIIRILLKWLLLPIPYSYVSDKINNTLQSYNKFNTQRKANISTYLISNKPNKWPQVFDAKCFDDYIDVEFEGGTFESMQYPESYLEATYGDWRQLPPQKDRVPQHGYIAYWK